MQKKRLIANRPAAFRSFRDEHSVIDGNTAHYSVEFNVSSCPNLSSLGIAMQFNPRIVRRRRHVGKIGIQYVLSWGNFSYWPEIAEELHFILKLLLLYKRHHCWNRSGMGLWGECAIQWQLLFRVCGQYIWEIVKVVYSLLSVVMIQMLIIPTSGNQIWVLFAVDIYVRSRDQATFYVGVFGVVIICLSCSVVVAPPVGRTQCNRLSIVGMRRCCPSPFWAYITFVYHTWRY